jgi:FKBP-type peptidyl-prolyl cis-trans isomerase FkpA
LKYIDFRIGDGREAVPGNQVAVLYRGTLTDDSVFDKKLDKSDPLIFVLGAGKVIQGWDLGIEGMKAGGRRKLIIPPELGYGNRQAGAKIPPNSTLIFEIELLKVR